MIIYILTVCFVEGNAPIITELFRTREAAEVRRQEIIANYNDRNIFKVKIVPQVVCD